VRILDRSIFAVRVDEDRSIRIRPGSCIRERGIRDERVDPSAIHRRAERTAIEQASALKESEQQDPHRPSTIHTTSCSQKSGKNDHHER
jgi:hypothetical protein